MTKAQLFVLFALGGFVQAVCASGAAAQSGEAASLGLSSPAVRGAELEGSEAARRGAQGTQRRANPDSEDEVESSSGSAQRAPCDKVISRYNADPSLERGRSVDISEVARDLNTSVIWVERCMLAYGKPVNRSHLQSAESAEDRLEGLEADEPEESAREEIDAGTERPEHTERPRVFSHPSKSIPTPGTGYELPE